MAANFSTSVVGRSSVFALIGRLEYRALWECVLLCGEAVQRVDVLAAQIFEEVRVLDVQRLVGHHEALFDAPLQPV